MGVRVDPSTDKIEVDGQSIKASPLGEPVEAPVYIALHKPTGVVSTVKDTHGRQTVLDLINPATEQTSGRGGARRPGARSRLYPVGRLDADTTGLLLLTNDGDLTFRLTHPRYGVEKEYRVLVRGNPPETALQKLREGVEIEGGLTSPAKVDYLSKVEGNTWLRVTIHEGRRRQVRLMTASIGHPVIELQRVRFGPVTLGDLEPGRWRNLAVHEVHALRSAVGLKNPRVEQPPRQDASPAIRKTGGQPRPAGQKPARTGQARPPGEAHPPRGAGPNRTEHRGKGAQNRPAGERRKKE